VHGSQLDPANMTIQRIVMTYNPTVRVPKYKTVVDSLAGEIRSGRGGRPPPGHPSQAARRRGIAVVRLPAVTPTRSDGLVKLRAGPGKVVRDLAAASGDELDQTRGAVVRHRSELQLALGSPARPNCCARHCGISLGPVTSMRLALSATSRACSGPGRGALITCVGGERDVAARDRVLIVNERPARFSR
jgi:hypothetical protein